MRKGEREATNRPKKKSPKLLEKRENPEGKQRGQFRKFFCGEDLHHKNS